jgi:mono/diheme cytochrome c family protein/plastocyanin
MRLMSELRPADTASGENQGPVPSGRAERRGELAVLVVLVLILVVLPATVLGYQFILRPALSQVRVIDIVAAAPEAGGFQPDTIRVPAGERVRLRFSVPDVTHGIAIGPGLGLDLGHVDPGQVQEIDVTLDSPGRYVFYCNSWCSPNHWRMRGTIEVYDPQNPDALPISDASDPTLESLGARGIDIDAPREAGAVPAERPSAGRGAAIVERLGTGLPPELADPEWRRTHSPVEAWASLVKTGLTEAEAWDAAAYLWLADVDAEGLQAAGSLYAKNCAACHGEDGNGRGPGADALAAQAAGQHSDMSMIEDPASFTDPSTMLARASDMYYAKLRRGGMGTGMPSFGPIFTPEETWALVDYLWTFVFDAGNQGGVKAEN